MSVPTDKIPVPSWPSPSPFDEFIRCFGAVQPRTKGGLNGWLGENQICDARRAIRIHNLKPFYWNPKGRTSRKIRLKCSSRHFYSDGLAVGKLETVFVTRDHVFTLPKARLHKFLHHVLNTHTAIKLPNSERINTVLARMPQHIAKLYLFSTTHIRSYNDLDQKPWVLHGAPLVLIVCGPKENVGIPRFNRVAPIPSEHNLSLKHLWHDQKGRPVRVWILRELDSSPTTKKMARTLRLYLLRLHAEHECLRLVLKNVLNQTISVTRESEEAEMLQYYLSVATKRIARTNSKSEEQFATDQIAELARQSYDEISPGGIDSLMQALDQIRPQIYRKVKAYTDEWMRNPEDDDIIVEESGGMTNPGGGVFIKATTAHITTGGTQMGDQNINYGQVGAQGSQARAENFSQLSQQVGDTINLSELQAELGVLRDELKKRATEPEHDLAIGAVAEAQMEAKKGDKSKVIQSLAKAGKWVLNVATDIGAKIVAEVITKSMGVGK